MDYKNHKAAVYTNATVEEVEFLVAGWVGFAVIHLHTHFTCCIEINDHVCPHTSLLLLFTAFIHRIYMHSRADYSVYEIFPNFWCSSASDYSEA